MQKSDQAKILNRRLTLQLIRDLAIYTFLFLALALFLNATFVPRLADDIADATSEWRYYNYNDYSLETCLKELDLQVYGVASSWEEANAMADATGIAVIVEQAETSSGFVSSSIGEKPSVDYVQMEGGMSVLRSNPFTPEELAALPIDPQQTVFLVVGEDSGSYWTTLRTLQEQTIYKSLNYLASDGNWQVLAGDESIQARDITTYKMVRAFKIPVAVICYFIGFVVVLFAGYSRALRYFDELSNAVEKLLANRDNPVKLSKPLLTTQEKLNEVRMASLADERAAQAAEQRKNELVAYLAHDVKTPLTSVIGYLTLLDEAPDMPEDMRKRYVKTAFQKSERLEELIDEFFEITRYNLQAIPIEHATVGIKLFCEQVAEEFYPEAESRNLQIQVEAPEEETFFVDPDKFARAFGNVVRNAVAYAEPNTTIHIKASKITDVAVSENADEAKRSYWELMVENQGREISEAHLESIFDKFYREDTARSSGSGRAGLGLAIAKEIVVAHGGKISATSAQGKTTFVIYIPL